MSQSPKVYDGLKSLSVGSAKNLEGSVYLRRPDITIAGLQTLKYEIKKDEKVDPHSSGVLFTKNGNFYEAALATECPNPGEILKANQPVLDLFASTFQFLELYSQ